MGNDNHETIEHLIHAAWTRLRLRLEDEPALLAQRLQRRRTPTLTRPPRAWCIALRASDHRLLSRVFPSHLPFGDPQFNPDDHVLTITTPVLRSITAPITLTAPGETLTDTAAKLGTSPAGLLGIRLNQTVRTHHIPPTCYKGHPMPLLYIEHPLDPCAKGFRPQDALWSWTSTFLATRIPDHFEQTLRRVAVYRPHVPRHRYDEFAHPELDDAAPRKSKRLPAPLIEPTCWYKWSAAGHYLGNDPTNWRKTFQDPGDRPRRDRPTRQRNYKPKPSTSAGSLHFNGYQWLCPACGNGCRTLYLPVEPINLLSRAQPRLAQCVEIAKSKLAGTFACKYCHGVRYFTSLGKTGWNDLISYLSAGLLYGREVPKPVWFKPQRKIAYRPHPNAPPSKRRPQVTELLLEGLSNTAIAKTLGLSVRTVERFVQEIYAQHNVGGRDGRIKLARKLNRPAPAAWKTRREQVREHLSHGLTGQEIETRMGLSKTAVEHQIGRLCKAACVKDRYALAEKLGWPFRRYQPPQHRRDRVRQLLAAGYSDTEIAKKMNMQIEAGRKHLRKIKRERITRRATTPA